MVYLTTPSFPRQFASYGIHSVSLEMLSCLLILVQMSTADSNAALV